MQYQTICLELIQDVTVHSGIDCVAYNRFGAYGNIHRWLSVGVPHYDPLTAIPTAQGIPCHS
jgi:hypothetical protein